MKEWFASLETNLQKVIISSLTSLVILVLGWIIRVIYERFSLKYKLQKEFKFDQKRILKEEISKNKIFLLNSAEDLSRRLQNFSQNVNKDWHNIKPIDWFKDSKYYLNSFVYRLLVFIHWILKTEKDTLSVDSTIADKNDIRYLKFIKSLKDILCYADLFEGLDYDPKHNTNHFYKNDLITYSKSVVSENMVIDFDEFIKNNKQSHKDIIKIVEYIVKIQPNKNDLNLNVLKCMHLILIQFLNTFGHDYQKTEKNSIENITSKYKNELIILDNFKKFIQKCKLEKEMKNIIKLLS